MLKNHPSIGMLDNAAQGLALIPGIDAVFVGGATTCLYIEDESIGRVRNTIDVDCTVEIASSKHYFEFETMLRSKGFRNDTESGVICRWHYQNVIIDIMPDDEHVIGFTNSWYKEGRQNRIRLALPSGTVINCFSIEYFLASKVEAFNKRGNSDYYGSKDLEDIILILDGVYDLQTIFSKENTATRFLKETFTNFLENKEFMSSFSAHIENSDFERARRIEDFFKSLKE
jgi:hypothetical protein